MFSKSCSFSRGILRFPHRRSQGGFAIVLSLALVVLLVLVVFGLAAFLGIEIQTSSSSLDREKARQNALAGLSLAVNQLQELAGPDARVTAPAGIQSSTDASNANWVGVWDATVPTSQPPLGWLVSPTMDNSAPANPTLVPANPATALADPAASPAPADVAWAVLPLEDQSGGIRVPLVDVPGGKPGKPEGKFGYWIADENAKANVVLNQPENPQFMTHTLLWGGTNYRDFQYSGSDAFRTEFWRWMLPQRLGVEELQEVDPSEVDTVEDERDLATASSLEGAELALDTPLRPKYFHDLTGSSRSVLTDVPKGRLKVDFMRTENARAFLNNSSDHSPMKLNDFWQPIDWLENLSPSSRTNNTTQYTPGLDAKYEALHEVVGISTVNPMTSLTSVVLTEFGIRFAVYRKSGAGLQPLVVKWQIEAEFWNPWNAHLEYISANALTVRAHGLPTITVSANGSTKDVNLEQLLNKEKDPGKTDLQFFADMPNGYHPKPGEVEVYRTTGGVKYVSEYNSAPKDIPAGKDVKVHYIAATVGSGVAVEFPDFTLPAGASLNVAIPAIANGNLTQSDFDDRSLDAGDRGHFQVTVGQGFKRNKSGDKRLTSDNHHLIYVPPYSFSATTVSNTNADNDSYLFGYGFEMVDDLSTILETQDPRSRPFVYEMIQPLADSDWSSDPAANTLPINTASDTYFHTGGPGFVLFEFLRDLPLSIGVMQHAPGDNVYQVGSSEFTDSNWFFDSGFMSGVPSGTVPADKRNKKVPGADFIGKTFGNPFLTLYSDPLNPISPESQWEAPTNPNPGLMNAGKASSHYMLEGGFNINSLSVPAWRLMLSGINLPLDPANPTTTGWPSKGGARKSLERAFFRFPYSTTNRTALKDEAALQALSATALEEEAFLPQIRSPSADQIEDLAEGVVAATKARGRPWASVKEFVDLGVLAHLLDPTGADGDPSVAGIPPVSGINNAFSDYKYAPIYLTQQDVLTQIAPMINVRGDTFLVRAYGDRRSPATGRVMATAVCEAIVQRVPTPAGQAVPLTESDNISKLPTATYPLGRSFKIVSLHWL